jgi:hypothetical protein
MRINEVFQSSTSRCDKDDPFQDAAGKPRPFTTGKFVRDNVPANASSWSSAFLFGFLLLLCFCCLRAETIPVRHMEGTGHGFLTLRTLEGSLVATGDLVQVIRGARVTSHLVFHFKDGSIDDETAVFTQRGSFHLITDHHIQKGPAFKHAVDLSIDAITGQVTVRSIEDGKEKVTTEHMDLPDDLANGMILTLMKNIRPETPETKVSFVAVSPKPRLVHLRIAPHSEELFSTGGAHHRAMHYVVQVEIGGIAGVVAPLLGKRPEDTHIWVLGGEAPTFIKSEGSLAIGDPVLRIELACPVWPRSAQ